MELLWVIQQAQNQPAKQCPNQQRLQLSQQTSNVLKSTLVTVPPQDPHQT